jgi:Leucine-rich repeat (LRR) protein
LKKILVLILVVFLIGCSVNTSNQVITFADENLENLIREEIEKPTGDILKSDVKEITILDCHEMKIEDISGIENLTNLDELILENNEITNIEPLKNLTRLTRLYLNRNKISDIEPLTNLTKLNHLVLRHNEITNIEPLKNLTKLKGLYLNHNPITDYSPVECYYDNLWYKDF